MPKEKQERATRRAVIAALGGATISFAGCSGSDDDADGSGTKPTETPATEPTSTPTDTPTDTDDGDIENGEEKSVDGEEVRLELGLTERTNEKVFDPVQNLSRNRHGDGWGMSNAAHLLSQVHCPLLSFPRGVQNEPQLILLEEYEATNNHTMHLR